MTSVIQKKKSTNQNTNSHAECNQYFPVCTFNDARSHKTNGG